MRLQFIGLLIFFSFPKNCLSQECEGFEQSTFEYFIKVLAKEDEFLTNKKFVFFDTIENKYSRFRLADATFSSEKNLKLGKLFIDSVAKAAYSAEQRLENQSFCKRITVINLKGSLRHTITRNRILLKIYKATKLGDVYYVQIKCTTRDGESDYFFQLNSFKAINKWFVQRVWY